ncbi:MAG: response regulator, partial [Treponema sp.]|nr:response regulator [Treponema sp.]
GSVFTSEIIQQTADPLPMAELDKIKSKKTLYYCPDPLLAASFGWTLDNLGVDSFAAENEADLMQRLFSGLWDYVFFPAECTAMVKDCIVRGDILTIPVLLSSASSDNNRLWDGLIVTYPYYTISVANAFKGKKGVYRWNGKVNFVCPDVKTLIVDDLDINLKIAQGMLAPYMMKISVCKDSVEALELIQDFDFDYVFLDQMMPNMDGDELVNHIRALKGKKYQDITIIAMTANALPGIRETFLEKGYNDYLSKPLDTYQLHELLERWIGTDKRKHLKIQDYTPLGVKNLDENIGMASCFHSRKTYQDLLYLYCSDLGYRLDLLRTAVFSQEKLSKEQESSVLSNLQILKSACETIGAASYAKTAFELEQGQRDMIQLSSFTDELAAFREIILQALQSA